MSLIEMLVKAEESQDNDDALRAAADDKLLTLSNSCLTHHKALKFNDAQSA